MIKLPLFREEYRGNGVLLPPHPQGLIHFLGGAFLGLAPQVLYQRLLESLAHQGYGVISTPFLNTFDHGEIAQGVGQRFQRTVLHLQQRGKVDGDLPVVGLGHSMGCKLQVLLACQEGRSPYQANIFLAFNNYPAQRSIPLLEQMGQVLRQKPPGIGGKLGGKLGSQVGETLGNNLGAMLGNRWPGDLAQKWGQTLEQTLEQLDQTVDQVVDQVLDRSLEFTPSPQETLDRAAQCYPVPRNLLIQFQRDDLDESRPIGAILQRRFPQGFSFQVLPGNHLTPLGQPLEWEPGAAFSPWDAMGQWMRQGVYQDLDGLQGTIAQWLADQALLPW